MVAVATVIAAEVAAGFEFGWRGGLSRDQQEWRDFPAGAIVRILHFHCRGHRFDPWRSN